MSVAIGFVTIIFVCFLGNVYGALDADCSSNGDTDCDAGNNEICSTGGSQICICNDGSSYARGPVQTTVCFLAVDLDAACTDDDQCLLGNGETGSICSATPDCVCDGINSYVKGAGGVAPCVKDCGNPSASAGYDPEATPASTIKDATATVTCATGYDGTANSITCQADGTWTAFTGCTIKDCGNPSPQAGYSAVAASGTTYQSTATVTCDTGNGYSGTPPAITCEASGSWTAYSGCSTGGGSVDCGNPSASAGYDPEATPASTIEGATATVNCATGYDGTANSITCQAGGTWTAFSGCTIKDCGNPSPQAGYSAVAAGGTTYQSTATVSCDTGNGYSGTPPAITCESSGSWTAYSGCSTGGGSVDCGTPSASAGYVPEANPSPTTQGATATVSCAAGYTGTAAQITCEASGSWSAYSGCSSAGTRTKLDFSLITVLAVVMLVLI